MNAATGVFSYTPTAAAPCRGSHRGVVDGEVRHLAITVPATTPVEELGAAGDTDKDTLAYAATTTAKGTVA